MGKSSILMVIGISTLMLISGRNMADVGVQSMDNSLTYYENTVRSAIAVSAANLVCSQVWNDPTWMTGYSNVNYNNGTFSATVTNLSGGSKKISASATYAGSTQNVTIVMRPSNFSKFAYYGGTSASAAAWETGDTIVGPSHTQGTLKTFGSPVFWGKATALSGITKTGSPQTPKFVGGFTSGISIPMPSNTAYSSILTAAASGYKQTGGTLYLKFNSSGTISYKTTSTAAYTTVPLSSFSPNGVIAIDKGELFVEGSVNGRVTLASLRSSGNQGGTTTITNSLTMSDNPKTNPNSDDMMGIVSYGDITIADNGATQFSVDGTLYSYTGGLAVEHGTSRTAGNLTINGGLIAEKLYATSNGAAGNQRKGYNLQLRFDERFATDSPAYFPATGKYEILSWFE